MQTSCAVVILSLAWATPALCEDAPAELKIGSENRQNFAASPTGKLRIIGDENRYDIVLPADLLFDFDKAELRPDAAPLLQELKAYFATRRADQVHVRGHTDSKGTPEYNYTLSVNRATAVCAWLKREAGLAFTNCIGRGEDEPLVPNQNADGSDNPQNRQLNRRVTISVVVYPDAKSMLGSAKENADAALRSLKERGTSP